MKTIQAQGLPQVFEADQAKTLLDNVKKHAHLPFNFPPKEKIEKKENKDGQFIGFQFKLTGGEFTTLTKLLPHGMTLKLSSNTESHLTFIDKSFNEVDEGDEIPLVFESKDLPPASLEILKWNEATLTGGAPVSASSASDTTAQPTPAPAATQEGAQGDGGTTGW